MIICGNIEVMKNGDDMFSEQLRKFRKIHGSSQAKFAAAIGVSQQAVAKWETNKATPNPDMLKKIGNFFNISVDTLLENVEENKMYMTNDLDEFLSQSQIVFHGNVIYLDESNKKILKQALDLAFMAIEGKNIKNDNK